MSYQGKKNIPKITDWKRAIRLNGTMLRKIMDSGELEFYQHAKVCSNTCRSTKIDPAASKVSAGSQMPAEHVALTPSAATNGQSVSSSDAEDGSEWVTAIAEDSVVFWCGVKQAGLLDEVLDDFREKLKDMLTSMQERVSQPPLLPRDVILLNDIVQNFGMLDLLKKVLAGHKSQMDQCREQYTQSLAGGQRRRDLLQCAGSQVPAVTLPPALQGLNGVAQNAAVQLVVANSNNNSNMALHAHLMPEVVEAQADSELGHFADLPTVAVVTESEEDQEC
ncbi:hypothetical protein CRUP_002133 [Coryphaenoides rupestris]|nr:hypothetical protein CRUP_002133 [Coryphaenoides rupestris]